jgi:DNA polymerase
MLWFYDFEVFSHDWLAVFINPAKRSEEVIINDPEALRRFHDEEKRKIFVGYNSRHYDQYILKAILCGFDPKKASDFIIAQGNPGWAFSGLLRKIPLNNYDVMAVGDRGLKSLEGFMGNDIRESPVPFDVGRPLTRDELGEAVRYCRHDVEQTVEVFLRRKDDFDAVTRFIKLFRLPLSSVSKTKAQLAAEILGGNGKGKTFGDEFRFPLVGCLRLERYRHVADWYLDERNHKYNATAGDPTSPKHKLETVVAGAPHVFGWGGAHGALPGYRAKGDFLIMDATAYYPSLQKRFGFGYRVMGKPRNFELIHDANVRLKREGDKGARLPFKIMDNAVSGQMKQPSSALYDPMGNNSVCVNGQLLLLDLVERLEGRCELVNNNTDGLIVRLRDYDRDFGAIDGIVSEWEERTGLEMGFETFFGEMFQKDVNNYLIADRETGEVKSKGAYVKKLSDLDYDLPIVNRALVARMARGVPVEETIRGCDDLKEFQLVARISGKYARILHGGEPLKEKCVRAFASRDETDGGLAKVHAVTGAAARIPNSPPRCFIRNESVNGVRAPTRLDKEWYVGLARKRLEGFGLW